MKARHVPCIAFAILAAYQIGQTAYYLADLPARVAVHFDAAGKANGWLSSAGVLTMVAVEIAIMTGIFAAAGLFRFCPVSIINLPNKDYWFAPERRDAAFAFLRDWLRWVLVLTLAFLSAIHGAGLRANLTTPPRLGAIWMWLVVLFVAAVVAMIVSLLRRFRLPRARADDPERLSESLTRSQTHQT